MRRVFFDENVPDPLVKAIDSADIEVSSPGRSGIAGIKNGELLQFLDTDGWDIFVTADKNLRYQQSLKDRSVSIVELPTNRLPHLRPMISRIGEAIRSVAAGEYLILK